VTTLKEFLQKIDEIQKEYELKSSRMEQLWNSAYSMNHIMRAAYYSAAQTICGQISRTLKRTLEDYILDTTNKDDDHS
jgi:hypothetical protein